MVEQTITGETKPMEEVEKAAIDMRIHLSRLTEQQQRYATAEVAADETMAADADIDDRFRDMQTYDYTP